jgi:hypothetical protein
VGVAAARAHVGVAATRAHVGVGAARPRPRRCRAVRSATSYAPITSPATMVRPRRRHSTGASG